MTVLGLWQRLRRRQAATKPVAPFAAYFPNNSSVAVISPMVGWVAQ
jgi:hypothetical protein